MKRMLFNKKSFIWKQSFFNLFAFFIVLTGIFFTQSCKEEISEEPIENRELTIENAKKWVESELSASNRSSRTGVASIKKHLNWEKAFLDNAENENAVVVPFDYEGGLAMNIGTVDDAKSGKSKIKKS